jgi:hypothetical protein
MPDGQKLPLYLSEEGLVTSVAVGSLRGLKKSDEEAVDRDELWAVPKNAARAFSNISSGTAFTSSMSRPPNRLSYDTDQHYASGSERLNRAVAVFQDREMSLVDGRTTSQAGLQPRLTLLPFDR